jgi:type VI secretion system protein ImpE
MPAAMNAEQLYRDGRLEEAIEVLGSALRSNPTDVRARTFLFELLCFAGAWDRAEKQLDVIADSSKEAEMGALLYRSALHGERERQDIFRRGAISEPPPGPVSGSLNGERFQSIADADPRVGARLEIIAAGQYTWVPFAHLAEVGIEAPRRLRDLLWPSARVKAGPGLKDFEFGEVIVPAVAPLSWEHPDGRVRLGREVDWIELSDGSDAPLGPKLLDVDGELVPILEVRELLIDPPAESD